MADLFSLICGYSEGIQYFHFALAIPPTLSVYTLHFGDQTGVINTHLFCITVKLFILKRIIIIQLKNEKAL